MAKKGFTPMIGLAVVVALALVAVFGAMSLTNPAFAAVGQSADTELAESTVSPQAKVRYQTGDCRPNVAGVALVNYSGKWPGNPALPDC